MANSDKDPETVCAKIRLHVLAIIAATALTLVVFAIWAAMLLSRYFNTELPTHLGSAALILRVGNRFAICDSRRMVAYLDASLLDSSDGGGNHGRLSKTVWIKIYSGGLIENMTAARVFVGRSRTCWEFRGEFGEWGSSADFPKHGRPPGLRALISFLCKRGARQQPVTWRYF